jgi:hydrogenase nickel incorporation protein HypB
LMTKRIGVMEKMLAENDRIAAKNHKLLNRHSVTGLNLVSAPGSGKTSLMERTLDALRDELRIGLIAGDVQTQNDADRLTRAGGRPVWPLVTGGACHLDAAMVARVLSELDLEAIELLAIENVGNLVCPASYSLGEDFRIVMMSTTEGDDKPLKYPAIFRNSQVLVINKTDLLGASDFGMMRAKENALHINGGLKIFELSCLKGDGLDKWYEWIKQNLKKRRSSVA